MTNFEYEEVKRVEAKKWLSFINFMVALVYIIKIIIEVMEQKSIVVFTICTFCWLSSGVLNLISYISGIRIIKSSYLR
jgi:hypothetical protein